MTKHGNNNEPKQKYLSTKVQEKVLTASSNFLNLHPRIKAQHFSNSNNLRLIATYMKGQLTNVLFVFVPVDFFDEEL